MICTASRSWRCRRHTRRQPALRDQLLTVGWQRFPRALHVLRLVHALAAHERRHAAGHVSPIRAVLRPVVNAHIRLVGGAAAGKRVCKALHPAGGAARCSVVGAVALQERAAARTTHAWRTMHGTFDSDTQAGGIQCDEHRNLVCASGQRATPVAAQAVHINA